MKHFSSPDVMTFPATVATYSKKTFLANGLAKWLPASLLAVLVDLQHVFNQLFFIIILLWFCDFLIGFLRAWHDPAVEVQWVRIMRSVLKLIVIGVGIVAVHLIEELICTSGVDTQAKLTGAVMVVIGVAESMSILDNLVYFFPGLGDQVGRIRALLDKARNGGTHAP